MQAAQQEGFREAGISSETTPPSSAESGAVEATQRGSSKRLGAMLNIANRSMSTGVSAVGRGISGGITGTFHAVKVCCPKPSTFSELHHEK